MPDQFAWADVFVLPSLCEGSAVSTYEAMLSGCPVICTPNTGVTPVRGMVTIVRVRDSRAIAEALDSWAERLEDIEDDVLGAVQAELDLSSYARRLLKAVTTDSMRVASTDRTSAPEEARKTINA
jgi:glycosyltransferase involved in cell wall biosynthesis